MSTDIEFVLLQDGDAVTWDVGQTEFHFQCCDCDLIHRFEIDAAGRGVMRFFREDEETGDTMNSERGGEGK